MLHCPECGTFLKTKTAYNTHMSVEHPTRANVADTPGGLEPFVAAHYQRVQLEVDNAINATPTGEDREKLTEFNIWLLSKLQ